jgi:hypothetical protein
MPLRSEIFKEEEVDFEDDVIGISNIFYSDFDFVRLQHDRRAHIMKGSGPFGVPPGDNSSNGVTANPSHNND